MTIPWALEDKIYILFSDIKLGNISDIYYRLCCLGIL